MPAELSRAICSMIFGGVLERLPGLSICFAHGGRIALKSGAGGRGLCVEVELPLRGGPRGSCKSAEAMPRAKAD